MSLNENNVKNKGPRSCSQLKLTFKGTGEIVYKMKHLFRGAYTWVYSGERNVPEPVDEDEEIELQFHLINFLKYWVSFCKK